VFKIYSLIIFIIILSGCVSKPEFQTVKKLEKEFAIEQLYLYSFLDLREKIMGQNLIKEIEIQFDVEFKKRGVEIEQLWFKKSDVLSSSSLVEDGNGVDVPVGDVIYENLKNEVATNTKYRLVAFPSYVRLTNTGVGYQVRWELFDALSNEKLWSSSSWTYNSNFIYKDELADERAKALVGGLMKQLESLKLVKKVSYEKKI